MSGGHVTIVLDRLSKQIESQTVLKNISLSLYGGDRVLLVGANGAGKSSLLRIFSGLAKPSKGSIQFEQNDKVISSQIGFYAHQSMLYGALTVEENLFFFADLLKVPRVDCLQALERWKLLEHRHKFPHQLSKGLLARVSLARSFCHNPRYIFLDEPTSALDQASVETLLAELESLASFHQGKMICVIVTHDITRLSSFARRVIVLDSGQVFLDSHLNGEQGQHDVKASLALYLERNR